MAKTTLLLLSVITALNLITIALAYDPRPLQDFCVADLTSTVRVNGLPCKDPTTAKVDDFVFRGLHLPSSASSPVSVKSVSVTTLPGLNTLGLNLVRFDLAPGAFIPPHSHPRASEVIIVQAGSVEAGFVDSSANRTHFSKILVTGDVFTFPIGLLHYFRNVGNTATAVLGVFNSQNPGIGVYTQGVFGAEPPINAEFLAKAYLLDKQTIQRLQAAF